MAPNERVRMSKMAVPTLPLSPRPVCCRLTVWCRLESRLMDPLQMCTKNKIYAQLFSLRYFGAVLVYTVI